MWSYTQVRMAIMKTSKPAKIQQKEKSYIVAGFSDSVSMWKTVWRLLKNGKPRSSICSNIHLLIIFPKGITSAYQMLPALFMILIAPLMTKIWNQQTD